ncbi:MAG: hypothetical protein IKS46_04460 [Clostridia bacterium]|nr:hypothetical protein [Clostridia bacterium]
MIEPWHVREALRFRFGSALADTPGIWDRAAAVLRNYAPYKDTFDNLANRLEDVLFNTVYEQLGPSMSARMDDGTVRRIRTSELKDAADDALGVLFDRLKVYSVTYESLREYFMATGSFAAMRVLYTHYADFMAAPERRILARIIRDSRPRAEWESWLDPEDIPPVI